MLAAGVSIWEGVAIAEQTVRAVVAARPTVDVVVAES